MSERTKAILVTFVTTILFASTISASADELLIIDSWWSGDYSKNMCERANDFMEKNKSQIAVLGCHGYVGCEASTKISSACLLAGSPDQLAREFEYKITSQMATNKNCSSIKIFNYQGPEQKRTDEENRLFSQPHWMLMLDFIPGYNTQRGDIETSNDHSLIHTEGNAKKIAEQLCTVLKGRGATIVK